MLINNINQMDFKIRFSKKLYKGFCASAIALSLSACDSNSSNDFGASGLNEATVSGGLTVGTVPENPNSLISSSTNVVNITALNDTSASAAVNFTVDTTDGFHVELGTGNYTGVATATVVATDATHADLSLDFHPASDLDAGIYSDSIEVSFCQTSSCDTHLEGSPYTISTNLTVNLVTAVGGEPLLSKSQNRFEIETDLFAATYVEKAGVFVAAVNSNPDALDNPPQTMIFIDPVTNKEGLIAYLTYPAISVTADSTGLTPRFVVGHANGWITVVDYNMFEPAASISTLLYSGFNLNSVAVNSTDVYAIPAAGGGTDMIRRTDISTNQYGDYAGVEVPAGSTLSAHASGNSIYVAEAGTGGSLQNFNITANGVAYSHTAPAAGAYDLCDGVWANADSTKLVTGCGYIFSSSESAAADMIHLGRIQPPFVGSLVPEQSIVDVADSDASTEIMTITKKRAACGTLETCPYTINFYNKGDYSHITSRAFGSFLAADDEPIRLEYPVAAGFSEDGKQLFVLTRLEEMSSTVIDVEMAYIHVIER